jgi:DNA-binding PucR family transcriptional regulator
LIRLTAAQIAVELSRDTGGSRGRRRGFWERLLARAYEDPLEARDDAQARGIALSSGYVSVAIEPEGLDESVATQKNAEIRRVCLDVLGTRTGEVVVIERGGGFFFLVPAPLEIDAANARTAATLIPRGITRAGLEVKVVGGVGRHAEMLHVARSVDESREATTIARRMFGGGRVMPYDDLGVYPLLHRTGATREDWRAFAMRVLDPLRSYDEKHQTELVRTLQLFFDVGQNIKEAAARLNVHRHTVFYRLRQIGEIGRLDLDSPHDQLTVRAALAVDALAD